MIIDFHTHIYPQKIAEKTIDFLLDKIPYEDKKASTNGTVNGLLDSMKRSDVDYSVTLPVVTSPKQFDSINRYAVEIKNTNAVVVTSGAKTAEFVSNGTIETLKANGADYTLSKPIININYTNYISIEDLVNIFDKQLVTDGEIAVISGIEKLFNKEYDSGLLRYIEDQLDIY